MTARTRRVYDKKLPAVEELSSAIAQQELKSLDTNRVRGFGYPTSIKSADYNASIDEIVLCDPTSGDFRVNLPALRGQDIPAQVIVKNYSISAAQITIVGIGATIDKLGFKTMSTAQASLIFVAISPTEWITIKSP